MLGSSLRFLGKTSLYLATTFTRRPTITEVMFQAFYYLHLMTTAQSVYPQSLNKFSRYFHFKVLYNVLFYLNIVLFYLKIVFCFEQKNMLIYFCLL